MKWVRKGLCKSVYFTSCSPVEQDMNCLGVNITLRPRYRWRATRWHALHAAELVGAMVDDYR